MAPRLPRLADRDEDVLLTVGDLHVENFGVWRNSRQRLVWGVNDFDDACELPFTSDLVRLATSAMLAASDARVNVSARKVCALLIEGYRSGLKLEGQPILVASDKALVRLTKNTQEDPQTRNVGRAPGWNEAPNMSLRPFGRSRPSIGGFFSG